MLVGQTSHILCTAYYGDVVWSFNDGDLPSNVLQIEPEDSLGSLLIIIHMDYSNNGIYSCRGRDESDSSYFYFVSYSIVQVLSGWSLVCIIFIMYLLNFSISKDQL